MLRHEWLNNMSVIYLLTLRQMGIGGEQDTSEVERGRDGVTRPDLLMYKLMTGCQAN